MKLAQYSTSLTALVLANLVPIIGVLFFNWDYFSIIFLYWMESAVIGYFNILKMKKTAQLKGIAGASHGFFVMHFGMFMFVHLIFILTMFWPGGENVVQAVIQSVIGFVFLFASHRISYNVNFIGKEEYKRARLGKLFFTPYKRIIVMHITIILGGFFAMSGFPVFVMIIFVILKIAVDSISHIFEHRNLS